MADGTLIWITGLAGSGKTTLAKGLYEELKKSHPNVIHLDGDSVREILGNSYGHDIKDRLATAYIYSRMCNFLVKQGMIVIMSTISLFHEIHDFNKKNNERYYEILLEVSKDELLRRNQKKLYTDGKDNVMGVHQKAELPKKPTMVLVNNTNEELKNNIGRIVELDL
jgi:adenylylsulfate kinase